MQENLSSQLNYNITNRNALIFPQIQTGKINIFDEWKFYKANDGDVQSYTNNFELRKTNLENPNRIVYLFQNYKNLSVNQIDKIINDFVKNKINFDEIINVINSSPNSELLDLAKSALQKYDESEYETIKTYLSSEEVNNYVKSFFIETIIDWELIDNNKRLRDLKELQNKIESENVFTRSIKFAIAELSQI